jgi:UDP-N-acetylglucosamine diphosphorylase / glucose-1-phosphate thymidylyltransferase / UDP-N-acetylgalactosamine diphosphorylase / glucosamine-1-phosphate N-acetyltransferase / galactosamine-1-phosphate N-acetyltransferase
VTKLVLLDPPHAAAGSDSLAPITSARPLAEVRAGALLIRERWQAVFGLPVSGVISSPRMSGFEEPGAAHVLHDDDVIDAGTIVALSDHAPALARIDRDRANTWTSNGVTVATTVVRSAVRDLRHAALIGSSRSGSLETWHLRDSWDIVGHLPAMLATDAQILATRTLSPQSPSVDVRVLGDHPVWIAATALIEPFVVLDATQGAIVIEDRAIVRSFSRISGPFVLGRSSQWVGGSGHTVSVGDNCKVHGEVSTTIVCGHANKGHDGFVGHSYLGRWTNLGAGTVTSNLKNTYGTVSFAGRETGLQFLGSLIGDHAKTGILTRLTTGTRVGVGASVVSDDVVPTVVKPFSFGVRGAQYDRDRFFETAERVMARRSIALSDSMRACLTRVYDELVAPPTAAPAS